MPLLTEDRALLASFRAGDRAALEEVYHHYVGGVARRLRFGFTIRGERGPLVVGFNRSFELESVLQEVFVRAFKERARLSYDGVRPYKDFLFGITKHVVLDELRKRSRRSVELMDDADLDRIREVDRPRSPEETLESKQAVAVVGSFLAEECDERDLKLYELRYRDDRSQEDAAKAAGLTRIQVRRWETKFRTRVLKYLKRVRYV